MARSIATYSFALRLDTSADTPAYFVRDHCESVAQIVDWVLIVCLKREVENPSFAISETSSKC